MIAQATELVLLVALIAPFALSSRGLLAQSVVVTLAAVTFSLHLAAHLSLAAGLVAWPLAALIAVVAWWRRGRPLPSPRADVALLVVLAGVALPRVIVAFWSDLPPGEDPAFHLVLARRVLEEGRLVTNWLPFEPIALHYPLGSHVLLDVLATLSRCPLGAAFAPLLAALGVLATAQVHALVLRLGGTRALAVSSALAYGAWAGWGSIDVMRWGGLPNMLGLCFLLGAVTALAGETIGWRDALQAAACLAAIVVTHHHVALASAVALLPLFVVTAATRGRRDALAMAAAGALGALLAAPTILVQLRDAGDLGATDALHVFDPIPRPLELLLVMGPVFAVAAIAGLALLVFGRGRESLSRWSPVLVPSLALIVTFVACAPVYNVFVRERYGPDVTLLTGCRFLTDATPFLAVLAGLGALHVAQRLRVRPSVAVATGLALSLTWLPAWGRQARYRPPPDFVAACRFIDRELPAATYVFTGEPWATFLAWRPTGRTPIPASEASDTAPRHGEINSLIRDGLRPPGMERTTVVRLGATARPGERILVSSGDFSVIEMSLRGPAPPIIPEGTR